ncbi:MAG: complex I NDUFA9 subunit family protein [Mariprofundaceae bacterium]|nr:complex I NDUFA9 subunit family protein [Mariprofundaceae bacterium]
MAQRVCIIGGSGFVGRAIVRQAIRAGHHVTVACRHPEKARSLIVEGVRLVKADLSDGRGLDDAIAGADCVINLVGLLFERGRYNFDTVHVHGTEHVLAACKRHGVTQYLHMSALGAGAIPASSYSRSKGDAEAYVRQSGMAWTLIRPSIIYGAGDSFFTKFKDMSAMLPILPVIQPETRFQPVWVEDVARVFVQSIGNRHVHGQTYELAGPKTYSFMELMILLMATLQRTRLLLPVPNIAAKLLASISRLLPTPLLTADQLLLLQHDNVTTGEAFPAQFGQPEHLESVLPNYITGNQIERLQEQLDHFRTRYRKH